MLGVGDKQAFVAVGRDAAKMLKEVIDKSQAEPGKEMPPFQVTVSALAIAHFVAAAAEDDEAKGPAQDVAGMLEKAEGKDHLIGHRPEHSQRQRKFASNWKKAS